MKIPVTPEMIQAARTAHMKAKGTDPLAWMHAAITAALDAAPTTDEDTSVDYHVMWASAEKELAASKETIEKLNQDLSYVCRELENAQQERNGAQAKARFWELRHKEAAADLEDAETMTPRELMDAAWETAYVPEDGIIPSGAEFLRRDSSGEVLGPRASIGILPAKTDQVERRLLAPPTPKRPNGAEEIEQVLNDPRVNAFTAEELADYLASHGVRITTKETR